VFKQWKTHHSSEKLTKKLIFVEIFWYHTHILSYSLKLAWFSFSCPERVNRGYPATIFCARTPYINYTFVPQAVVCRGCKRTPKSFDLVKIRAKFLKIRAKSVEIWSQCVKTFANSLDVLWFLKNGALNQSADGFLEVIFSVFRAS